MGRPPRRHITKRQAFFEQLGINFEKPEPLNKITLAYEIFCTHRNGREIFLGGENLDPKSVPEHLHSPEYLEIVNPLQKEIEDAKAEIIDLIRPLNAAICNLSEIREKAWDVINTQTQTEYWNWGGDYQAHGDDYHEKVEQINLRLKDLEFILTALKGNDPKAKLVKEEIKDLENLKKTL